MLNLVAGIRPKYGLVSGMHYSLIRALCSLKFAFDPLRGETQTRHTLHFFFFFSFAVCRIQKDQLLLNNYLTNIDGNPSSRDLRKRIRLALHVLKNRGQE